MVEKKINKGNKISLDYEGRLESGEVFDSSKHEGQSHPLEFEVGSGTVIRGFDEAVLGMQEGEEKEFTINPKEAYGDYNPSLKQEVPKKALPTDLGLKAGTVLMIQTPQGNMPVKISEVTKESIFLDLNHPLAGKKLIFRIKIISIA